MPCIADLASLPCLICWTLIFLVVFASSLSEFCCIDDGSSKGYRDSRDIRSRDIKSKGNKNRDVQVETLEVETLKVETLKAKATKTET